MKQLLWLFSTLLVLMLASCENEVFSPRDDEQSLDNKEVFVVNNFVSEATSAAASYEALYDSVLKVNGSVAPFRPFVTWCDADVDHWYVDSTGAKDTTINNVRVLKWNKLLPFGVYKVQYYLKDANNKKSWLAVKRSKFCYWQDEINACLKFKVTANGVFPVGAALVPYEKANGDTVTIAGNDLNLTTGLSYDVTTQKLSIFVNQKRCETGQIGQYDVVAVAYNKINLSNWLNQHNWAEKVPSFAYWWSYKISPATDLAADKILKWTYYNYYSSHQGGVIANMSRSRFWSEANQCLMTKIIQVKGGYEIYTPDKNGGWIFAGYLNKSNQKIN